MPCCVSVTPVAFDTKAVFDALKSEIVGRDLMISGFFTTDAQSLYRF